jgi:hypothetical protein
LAVSQSALSPSTVHTPSIVSWEAHARLVSVCFY